MFLQTITLFNYISSKDEYTPVILSNVEFQPYYKTYPRTYETSDETNALIIINLNSDSEGVYALSKGGSKKYYLPKKKWGENTDYFTIQNNFDFLILDEYTPPEINLGDAKNTLDNVFVINGFKYFMDDLKHFELYVN